MPSLNFPIVSKCDWILNHISTAPKKVRRSNLKENEIGDVEWHAAHVASPKAAAIRTESHPEAKLPGYM